MWVEQVIEWHEGGEEVAGEGGREGGRGGGGREREGGREGGRGSHK